jgi:hypothetical protein
LPVFAIGRGGGDFCNSIDPKRTSDLGQKGDQFDAQGLLRVEADVALTRVEVSV